MNKFFSVFVILCLIGASSSKHLRVSYSGDLHPAHRRLSEEGLLNLKIDGRGYFGFRLRVSVTDASADGSQSAHAGLYDQAYGAAQVGTAATADYAAAVGNALTGSAEVKCVYGAATTTAGASCGVGASNAANCASRAVVVEVTAVAPVTEECVDSEGATDALCGLKTNQAAGGSGVGDNAASAAAATTACIATDDGNAGDSNAKCSYRATVVEVTAVAPDAGLGPLTLALDTDAAVAAAAADVLSEAQQPGSGTSLATLNAAAKAECEALTDVQASVDHVAATDPNSAQVGTAASADFAAANSPAGNTPLTAADEKIYSRDGSLHINKYGYLVDDNGLLLYGSGQDETDVEAKKHIHIPSRAGDVIVTPSGKVLAEENGGASFQIAGQIKLTRFENPQGLNIRLKMKSNCAAANEDGFALGNWCAGGELDGKDHTYLSETLVSGVGISGNPGDQGFGRISA